MLSLELALTLPTLFVLLLLVFHAAVFGRDLLLVQDAARRGARVAATTLGDAAVVAAARDHLAGRPAEVSIQPGARRAGDVVRVTVTVTSRAGLGTRTVTGSSAAAVEPGIR